MKLINVQLFLRTIESLKYENRLLAEYKIDMVKRAVKLCDCSCKNKKYLLKMFQRDEPDLRSIYYWPKNLSFKHEIDGVFFTLYKSGEQPKSLIRLYVDCPMCDKHVPAGRIHQHAKVHL